MKIININKKQLIRILLILIWMTIVFLFSNQPGDISEETSRGTTATIIKTVVRKTSLTESEQEKLIENIDPVIRKLAHYTIYLIGGILIISFMDTLDKNNKQKIMYSIIVGVIYAITDEIHQYFIVGRSMRILDVFIDTLGVCTGITIFLLQKKLISKNKDV